MSEYSIGYSDFFISELSSDDSQDSVTGEKLTLDQRRKRHQDRKDAKRHQKLVAKSSPLSPVASPVKSGSSNLDGEHDLNQTHATAQNLTTSLSLLHARIAALLATATESTPTVSPSLQQSQLTGISAALNSATLILDAIEDPSAATHDPNNDIASGISSLSTSSHNHNHTNESRAQALIQLSDRIRLFAETLRDEPVPVLHVSSSAKHAIKQRDARVDTVIRRVSREIKKGGM
ncbi:UNVERIFIED_CONTAM: hypothetical protein HDU68_005899 [Siphonaria sp. JEL0065]|nr:hypothetical protein HDU68_005899 [Siphonaria sp. JEL0065]